MGSERLSYEEINSVRQIKGFPDADDSVIQDLSKKPQYTACPNPFLNDFIERYGKKYDSDKDDYSCEPFSSDLSEDKHDLIYNIHGYHTKVPPKAIKKCIEHYTSPGDVVLDVFCGSGMTGVAAQLCDPPRAAIISDISPYATFIASNYNEPNNRQVIKELEEIINRIESEYGDYYLTIHEKNTIDSEPSYGSINYVVWSCIVFCPNCGCEINYYDVLMKQHLKSTDKSIRCPKCNLEIEKSKFNKKKLLEYDPILQKNTETPLFVPTLINYSVGKKRFSKTPDEEDLAKIKRVGDEQFHPVPNDDIREGDKTTYLINNGIVNTKQLYPKRALFFLSKIWDECKEDNKKLFLLTSALTRLTILNRYMPEHGSRALVGPKSGTFYLPPLFVENDVIGQLRFQLKKLGNLQYRPGNVCISTQSATDLSNIPSDSIDYVFIDPPFGSNIMYSELNYVPESWLKIKTNNHDEAIINDSQKKGVNEYQKLMTESLTELYRVLKPKRWITIEFHNSKNTIWNTIQQGLNQSGFVVADVRVLDKEKKTINQFSARGCVDQDLIISAYKPDEKFIESIRTDAGSTKTAWDFTTEHLKNLPIVVVKENHIEPIAERQRLLLYDRMIAYHVMQGIPIPISASDYYRGLDDKYVSRDGMYFLPSQVNKYDSTRVFTELKSVQTSLFVSNEKSAIAWLYSILSTPQTYSEIQPKFMLELKMVDKYEAMPELLTILEENFLQSDNGKWYIPDSSSESDLIKLREKNLLKEFSGYLSSKGKLKSFRIEAIKVGFAKLWADKKYSAIVELAERLPETTIQEDDKLLMYYDISLGRI